MLLSHSGRSFLLEEGLQFQDFLHLPQVIPSEAFASRESL